MAGLKRWLEKHPDVLHGLAYRFVRLLGSTLRVERRNFPEDHSKRIYVGWHGRSFIFSHVYRQMGWWVIISNSRDGEIQTGIFQRLGYQIARGSTGKGGERAAVKTIKALRDGGTMAMTPDGPRGPTHVIQSGIMLIAQRSGAQLVPVGVSANRRWLAKSWDQYLLPKPFAKGLLIAGEPVTVPKDATPEEVEEIRLQVQNEINRLEELAEREFGL